MNGKVAMFRMGIEAAPDEYVFGSQSPESSRVSSERFSIFAVWAFGPDENCCDGDARTEEGTNSALCSCGASIVAEKARTSMNGLLWEVVKWIASRCGILKRSVACRTPCPRMKSS